MRRLFGEGMVVVQGWGGIGWRAARDEAPFVAGTTGTWILLDSRVSDTRWAAECECDATTM